MSEEVSLTSHSNRKKTLQNLTNRSTTTTTNNNMAKFSLIDSSSKHKEEALSQDLLPPLNDNDDVNGIEINNNSDNTTVQDILESTSATMDEVYLKELEAAKIRHWKTNEFAVGCVDITWNDELSARRNKCEKYQNKHRNSICASCSCCCQDEIDPTCGCLYLTGLLCSKFKNVKRVGNMIVLRESIEMVDCDNNDEEQDQQQQSIERRKLDIIVGPFWPMMICVTYPIIFSVSIWTYYSAFINGNKPFVIFILWICSTFGLIFSLFQVAFRDPGILRRCHDVPKNVPAHGSMRSKNWWKWSDVALTYRPYGALYDPDCACVIEGFDHTCPWTGTAIGNKNMAAFQSFVALVFICLIMDILLLTGLFEMGHK